MRCLFVLVVLAASAPAYAQVDVVSLSARAYKSAELEDRQGQLEQRSLSLAITPPPRDLGDPRTKLITALIYRRTHLDLDDGAAFASEPATRHVNAIDVSVGLIRVLGSRWILTLGVTPGLRSDFEQSLSSKDFQIAGYAIASYLIGGNPHFQLFFGLTAQTHPSLIPVIPIAGINYDNGFFFFQTSLAGQAAFVRFSERVELGAFASFGSDWYHVEAARAPEVERAEFLRITDIGFGPMLNVRAVDKLWVNLRAGYAVQRRASYGDEDRDYLRGVSLDPTATFFVQAGLSWRRF